MRQYECVGSIHSVWHAALRMYDITYCGRFIVTHFTVRLYTSVKHSPFIVLSWCQRHNPACWLQMTNAIYQQLFSQLITEQLTEGIWVVSLHADISRCGDDNRKTRRRNNYKTHVLHQHPCKRLSHDLSLHEVTVTVSMIRLSYTINCWEKYPNNYDFYRLCYIK